MLGRVALVSLLAATQAGGGDPTLSVPADRLAAAVECVEPAAPDPDKEPVLLVHGTGVTPEENWSWNYLAVLPGEGWTTCTVRLPDRATGDIQVASEYVVHAIRAVAERTGKAVDVLGHSQGGLEPRWALRWWPGTRVLVDDLVTLASPHHGTVTSDVSCANGCFPAAHQMRTTSRFVAALNSEDETPGDVSTTSIATRTDELVQPVETTAVEGATNVVLQDLCPGRATDHAGIAGDAVAYALVVDAFTTPGPADPARIDRLACADVSFVPPGAAFESGLAGLRATDPFDPSRFRPVAEEPPLAAYAAQSAPGGSTTTSTVAPAVPTPAASPTGELPATGGTSPLPLAGLLLAGAALAHAGRRRIGRS